MAEVAVAVPILVFVINKLFDRVASPEFRRYSTAYRLKQLKSKLDAARVFLNDAEDKQVKDDKVKKWLSMLKHVIFQAVDFVEDIDNNKNKQMLAIKSLAGSLLRTPVDKILEDMEELIKQAGLLGLQNVVRRSSLRSDIPIPWRGEDYVYGRDGDKKKILELIRSDEAFGSQRIGVVPIVGMGGMGKTTLAQIIFDHFREKESAFKCRAWVHVSTEFDYCKILNTILREINVEKSNDMEQIELQRRIKAALGGKKFIFFLDDVWSEDAAVWNALMTNFTTAASGSRIVVTTQSRKVGSIVKTGPMYELREVSIDDCWKIFIDHAFKGDPETFPQLHDIGKRIVEKCKGLPLAVTEIGGHLSSIEGLEKEWEKVLNSHLLSGNIQDNEVLSMLWQTYVSLSPSQQQCFAYCSAFPKGYQFCKKQMVLLWMAEGFLPSDEKTEESMEEIVEKDFDGLVSKSLFRQSRGDESKFAMHDLYHELAAFVSGDFCVSLSEDVKLDHITAWTRHLSHSDNVSFDSKKLWPGVSKARDLRTFLSLGNCGDFTGGFVEKLITNQRHLRVLSLYTKESISFGNLKHLRYLNLSRSTIVEVPSSVCDLFNLQTLILSECSSLPRLPGETRKLKKLRHLDITGTNLTYMPPRMGNLKELRTLTNFVLGDSGGVACSKIKEIGELQHLRKLRISKLQNVAVPKDGKDILRSKEKLKELALKWDDNGKSETKRDAKDEGKDILKNKKKLKELALEWDDNGKNETKRDAKDVLDALQPHTNLEKLVIWNYPDLSFPSWVGEMSKLVSMELKGVFCNSFPPLWRLPTLLKLVIEGFPVEKIDHEFYGGNSSITSFQCLETLEFRDMKSLKVCVFHDRAFPRLKHLTLFGCPEMESFPVAGSPKSLNLRIDSCAKLKSLILLWIENLGGLKSINGSAFQQAKTLSHLSILTCDKLESLPEKDLFGCLSTLDIDGCPLIEIKYHKCRGESCQHVSQNILGSNGIKETAKDNQDLTSASKFEIDDGFLDESPSLTSQNGSVVPVSKDGPKKASNGTFLTAVNLLPRGLKNSGNLCFLNSTVQALLSCSPFVQLLQELRTENIPKAGYPTLSAFVEFVAEFDLPTGSNFIGTPFRPAMFEGVLKKFTPDISCGKSGRPRQEDAQEFLSFVLNQMHDELFKLEGQSRKSTGSNSSLVSSSESEELETVGPKNKSAVFVPSKLSEIFRGQLQSVVKANGNRPSPRVQPFMLLQLDIHPEAVHTIEDALKLLFVPETIADYRTSEGEVVTASKSTKIQSLSKIMILHLKRFDYGSQGSTKLLKPVHFPLEFVLGRELLVSSTTESRKYELVATITHHGGEPSKGHYTADVWHSNGQWLRFDDDLVTVIAESKVLHDQAYVLVYKQL